MVSVWDSVK